MIPLLLTAAVAVRSMTDSSVEVDEDQRAIRDTVYRSVLANRSLSDEHRANLRDRGLSNEQIDHRGYRTHTAGKAFATEPEYLDHFRATPGFLIDGDGRLKIKAGNCILLPVRDNTGAIVAIKCRRDRAPDGQKYHWLSSRDHEHPDAPSPGAPVHVPLGITAPVEVVRLTEGELKADVATCLNCTPTIGVSGVATWQNAEPVLRELGAKRVKLAFDSDARRNRGVAQHLWNCARALSEKFAIEYEWWPDTFKAIDDLLAAGQTPNVLTGDAAIRAIRENAEGLGVDVSEPKPAAKSAATQRRASGASSGDADFLTAKAAIDLAELLNRDLGRTRGGHWHCPFHEGKGRTLSIFRDRLGIGRYHCFHPGCGVMGDAIDFVCRHRGLSFTQACEHLGLIPPRKTSNPAAQSESVSVEARKHAEVHAWLLADCRYRGRCVVLVRSDNPEQFFNVFPPCDSRYVCPYCRREWERERIERFSLGIDQFAITDDRVESLFDLDREFFFTATLPPQQWHATWRRIQRRAKRAGRPLLFAAVETYDLAGEPVVHVVARERLRKVADDLPAYPAAIVDVWSDGVRHSASSDVRNPVTFSKAWPFIEEEQSVSDFERVCSVNATEADVEAMARGRGFQVTKGRWGNRNVMPMRASFGDDPGRYQSEVEKFYGECEVECQHRERLEAHANLPDEEKYGWLDDW